MNNLFENMMIAILGGMWTLFIADKLGWFQCKHIKLENPLYEISDESDIEDNNDESNESDESDDNDDNDNNDNNESDDNINDNDNNDNDINDNNDNNEESEDIFDTSLTEKQKNFLRNQGVELPDEEYIENKKSMIRSLSANIAPILEQHRLLEPVELQSLINDTIHKMNIDQESLNKLIDHFTEPKIKELQSMLNKMI